MPRIIPKVVDREGRGGHVFDGDPKNRPDYQKIIMGYLAYGNSVHDILELLLQKMSDKDVQDLLVEIGKLIEAVQKDENVDVRVTYRDVYKDLVRNRHRISME